jgi:dihydroxyacetone kinase-like protein
MALTTQSLRIGIATILAHLDDTHARLTELDGQIGDGDLGITLLKAFRELDRVAPGLPEDVGQAFMAMAQAVAKVSSSSFGTLLATSLMTGAKATKGETAVEWTRLPDLLIAAREAMSARGKANLGDKTVLDPLQAAAEAAQGIADPAALARAALGGIDVALEAFRDKPPASAAPASLATGRSGWTIRAWSHCARWRSRWQGKPTREVERSAAPVSRRAPQGQKPDVGQHPFPGQDRANHRMIFHFPQQR